MRLAFGNDVKATRDALVRAVDHAVQRLVVVVFEVDEKGQLIMQCLSARLHSAFLAFRLLSLVAQNRLP
jgi:hypothetical protein